MKTPPLRDAKIYTYFYNLAKYSIGMVMKKLLFSVLLIALFMAGCSSATPLSNPSPVPTATD